MKKYLFVAALAAFLFSASAYADHEEHPNVVRYTPQECLEAAQSIKEILSDRNKAYEYFQNYQKREYLPGFKEQWVRFWQETTKLEQKPSPVSAAVWFYRECSDKHGNPNTMFNGNTIPFVAIQEGKPD